MLYCWLASSCQQIVYQTFVVTRCSAGFHPVCTMFLSSVCFHYIFTRFVYFTKFSPGFHQVFTRFSPGVGFHQVFTMFGSGFCFHQVFTYIFDNMVFTRFSPGFHQVFTRFSPGFHQVFIKFCLNQLFTFFFGFTKFSPSLLVSAS